MPSIYADDPVPSFVKISRIVYALLVAFPIVCFSMTLGTDILYWQTSNLMWVEFSAWLLLAGIVTGVAALPFAAVDFFSSAWEFRTQASAWAHVIGRIVVLILAFFNNLVHAADGWAAVMPWGLTLSALTVLVMLVALSQSVWAVEAAGNRGRYHV